MAGRPLSFLADIPVDKIAGIGPRAVKKLASTGVHSVADLLLHVPRRYLDRSQLFDLGAVPVGEEVTVGGVVVSVEQRRISGRRTMTTAVLGDDNNVMRAVWFNPYIKIKEGEEILLSGTVERFRGRLQMKSPDIDRLGNDESLVTGRVVPVHPSLGGLTPYKLRAAIANALARSQPIGEVLPEDLLDRLDLMDRATAFQNIHFPSAVEHTVAARRRLVFDELFRLELSLALKKHAQQDSAAGVRHRREGATLAGFVDALPYELTGAQRRSIDEIHQDMESPHPMHRLLQGEVGSGKTVVAVAGLLTAVQSGYQGAVMAPTEVLAEQHYFGTVELLSDAGLQPTPLTPVDESGTASLFETDHDDAHSGVRVALLTGNRAYTNFVDATTKRADVVRWIADGTVDVIVGTHALIQESLTFARLGLAVVDEQHRFGVYQRVQLRDKAQGYDPDLLIMTATPIPRTLAMTLYGDLDVSVLDEMPPGRTPVVTHHISKTDTALTEMHSVVRSEVAAGRQVFVVCPLIEDSDKLEAASATAEHERLSSVFAESTVGLLHGQMRPDEKETVMAQFKRGQLDVLVATTVIEVGIDIPNATVMIIEDADRFGLSQLHQLRGRVGRGQHAATCFLVADPTTAEGERRIAAMVETTDGFKLAEVDLAIRGQGTVFGTRQAGAKDLKLADILKDADTLVSARREAFAMVADDPDLSVMSEMRHELETFLGEDAEWLVRS
jgi:ATP-dependent DNA helicase RecG